MIGLELGDQRILRPGPLRWLRALAWMLFLFLVFGYGYDFVKAFGGPTMLDAGKVLAACAIGFALYAGAVRLAEGRWPEELKLGPALAESLIGLVIGTAVMAMIVCGLLLLGVYRLEGPQAGSPWPMAGIAISSGFMEELIFRAIAMRLMIRAFGFWNGFILQAILFGGLHLANPNASLTAGVAIALEAGLMLAAFYVLTGRLWMPIGVHAAWNFTQGWLWGAPVSGTERTPSLFTGTPAPGAPEILSGGAFGPEASLPALVAGVSVGVLVLWLAVRRGRLRGSGSTA